MMFVIVTFHTFTNLPLGEVQSDFANYTFFFQTFGDFESQESFYFSHNLCQISPLRSIPFERYS